MQSTQQPRRRGYSCNGNDRREETRIIIIIIPISSELQFYCDYSLFGAKNKGIGDRTTRLRNYNRRELLGFGLQCLASATRMSSFVVVVVVVAAAWLFLCGVVRVRIFGPDGWPGGRDGDFVQVSLAGSNG